MLLGQIREGDFNIGAGRKRRDGGKLVLASFDGRLDMVCGHERLAKRNRRTLVEQDAHGDASREREATLRVFQNCVDLGAGHAGEPVEEVPHGGTTLDILEKGANRNTGTPEDPVPADKAWYPLHDRALRPIKHDDSIHLSRVPCKLVDECAPESPMNAVALRACASLPTQRHQRTD